MEGTFAEFQYIICCWFNEADGEISVFPCSFNTLYVVGSKNGKSFSSSIFIVSIHYMLLVQMIDAENKRK